MALIIPFTRKETAENSVNEVENNTDDCLEAEPQIICSDYKESRKIRIIPQNGQRIISIDKFRFQKDNDYKNSTEHQKLREGLIIKIHQHKQALLDQYKENSILSFNELQEELLNICADYADEILDLQISALGLLNKYEEFKKVITLKLAQLTGTLTIV